MFWFWGIKNFDKMKWMFLFEGRNFFCIVSDIVSLFFKEYVLKMNVFRCLEWCGKVWWEKLVCKYLSLKSWIVKIFFLVKVIFRVNLYSNEDGEYFRGGYILRLVDYGDFFFIYRIFV